MSAWRLESHALSPVWGPRRLPVPGAHMGTDPRKATLFSSKERVCPFSPVERQFLPRDTGLSIQTRTKRPAGTWLQARDSVRFSTNSLSRQKMFAVIPPNHDVKLRNSLGTERFDGVHSCGTCRRHSGSNYGRTQNDYSGTDKRKRARLMDIRYVFGD
jgi:hypothetical protein